MQKYLDLLRDIKDNGVDRPDRTGTGTRSVFGRQIRFDLTESFPLITTKKVYMKSVIHELLWFLKGDTNIKYLQDNGVHIWDEWADGNGDLGPVYGKQWRDFGGVDQIQNMIDLLHNDPDSRRNVVAAWNPQEVEVMNLPPCHMFFQVYSRPMRLGELRKEYLELLPQIAHFGEEELVEYLDEAGLPIRYLDLQMYQRSADVFLGVPFNIASYALLLNMIAAQTNHVAHEYVHSFGDVHIYYNHMDQVETQLMRHPRTPAEVDLEPSVQSLFDYTYEDIVVGGYDPHPAIKAKVAV